ncbi:C40 family peptidase [Ferruginibacter sp. HRS2-29]|uniref:C40 family peptidase n=1 Tax=Ferruginibacter sp. HRS2-29 TaxID=2487334 RepID=UPI0020CC00D5|nr:C40 family peptidase [Ferruginibacter sp. HRS2-29]MCP9749469.1 NlpC/P60 family protein [Ferruginibacter sp. HRS2-29]
MKYAVCIVPVAPVRLVAGHREEMTSQYIFGETGRIKDSNDEGWIWLESTDDQYSGWCRGNQFMLSENAFPQNKKFTGEWVNDIFINGKKIHLPFASSLSLLDHSLPGLEIRYQGKIIDAAATPFHEKNILKLSSFFLGTGYLWGGKTVFGIDCSGFVQSVYRLMDIRLMRDANQQVTQGDTVGFLEESQCGDLAFFDDETGAVVHVGILLSTNEIIHSSGNVRIDKIDNEGIVNVDTGLRTHRLRTIKRIC